MGTFQQCRIYSFSGCSCCHVLRKRILQNHLLRSTGNNFLKSWPEGSLVSIAGPWPSKSIGKGAPTGTSPSTDWACLNRMHSQWSQILHEGRLVTNFPLHFIWPKAGLQNSEKVFTNVPVGKSRIKNLFLPSLAATATSISLTGAAKKLDMGQVPVKNERWGSGLGLS
jgi:hypothetical protein